MAKTFGVSRSGYYDFCRRQPSQRERENEALLEVLRGTFRTSRETYGSPRMHAELKEQGFKCSRPRVARLMRKYGMAAKMRRLFRTTTTLSSRRTAAPNLLEQNFRARAPNEKWVADVSVPQQAVWKMKVGPSQSIYRNWLQTTVSGCSQKLWS